jgi:hypothetical protein
MKGVFLSSLTDASGSMILPFFRKTRNNNICAVNPNTTAVRIVTVIGNKSYSSVNAKIANIRIVNVGGTKMVEIILASLFLLTGKIKFRKYTFYSVYALIHCLII